MEIERRNVLRLVGGVGLMTVLGACRSSGREDAATSSTSSTSSSTSSTTSTTAARASGAVAEIADETAGPYPGDGSNGPNILSEPDLVRSDIRRSIGAHSGVAAGVPLTITLRLLDLSRNATPGEGLAVYLWQADRDEQYSMYNLRTENYLRGVQATGADGRLTFKSIFPACYADRWPHIHFSVYESVDAARRGGNKLKTSQLALPEDVCKTVYASPGYTRSTSNLSRVSLETDNVFRDGWSSELATVTGSVADGYTATLTVAI